MKRKTEINSFTSFMSLRQGIEQEQETVIGKNLLNLLSLNLLMETQIQKLLDELTFEPCLLNAKNGKGYR